MKRLACLILALAMMFTMCSAFAEEKERITITASYIEFGTADQNDEMNKYITDKFGIDIEMTGMRSSSYINDVNVMAYGGTLLDWCTTTLNYDNYVAWAEQGLVKAMPEGWEEKYPNIARAVEASGIGDKLMVDGQLYALPEVVYFNMMELDPVITHICVHYRTDWLEQLGMEPWGDTVTIDELVAFAKAAVEADLAGNGQTIGISGTYGRIIDNIMMLYCERYGTYEKIDGQYIWNPGTDAVVEGVQYIAQLYKDGIIDPDFYLENNSSTARFDMIAGNAAVLFDNGNPSAVVEYIHAPAAANGISEHMEMAVLTDNDGKFRGVEASNYWQVNVFSPDLDDEKFARLLEMIDWFYTKEFEELQNFGFEGVDWERGEDGSYVILSDYASIRTKYPSLYFYYCRCIAEDEVGFVNPSFDSRLLERINTIYDVRTQLAKEGGYSPLDLDYDYYSSDVKNNYSLYIPTEICRIVADESIAVEDIPSVWQTTVVEAYENMWKPLLDEINEKFCK